MTTFELPAIVWGPRREVDERARDAVRRLRDGASWPDALDATDTVDVGAEAGLIVLDGPSPLLDDEPQFHLYLPWLRALDAVDGGRLPQTAAADVFGASLAQPWGVLGLVARASLGWVLAPGRQRPLVDAAVGLWASFEAVGGRYSNGSRNPQALSTLATSLHYALGQIGVPGEALRGPLAAAELARLAGDARGG